MKDLVKNAISILLLCLMTVALPTEAEGEIYEDTVRLHILANSDSEEDQELKLMIRDRLLTEYAVGLSSCRSAVEAEKVASSMLRQIEKDVEGWIAEFGYDYTAEVTLTTEWYERREYDDFTLPAGRYVSLRVIIGGGEGKNWWCVMYPPLCMEIATENAPADDGLIDYSKEEILLIKGGKYNVKLKILEELSRAFAKNG